MPTRNTLRPELRTLIASATWPALTAQQRYLRATGAEGPAVPRRALLRAIYAELARRRTQVGA